MALKEIIETWFSELWEKIKEDPGKTLIALVLCSIIIPALAKVLWQSFSPLTFIGYVFTYIYGLTKIIDKPERPIAWCVGFIVCATAIKLLFDSVIPIANGKDAVSLFSALVILYVVAALYFKGRDLKKI